ncbi:MAG: MotA/TolQ/ExbB proton channel family protein [Bacteroidetes bacterium]|nr:MotA/TolQ/ExbB proton channel family protein [Bacteroidota bacterium]
MRLLQIVSESAATTVPAEQSISLLELVSRGGWVMFPIGFLALVSVYLIVERFITINRAGKVDTGFMTNIKTMLLDGKIDAALSMCRSSNTPIARLLEKGIKRLGKPVKEIESAVENTGKLEIYKLEKNLSYLGIIAGIAPMLGFIGTISGVINIFYKISISADFGIQQISDGLYEKMVTSAAGLMVGIIAHIGFHLLNTMIDRVTFQLESTTVEFIDLIQEPGK